MKNKIYFILFYFLLIGCHKDSIQLPDNESEKLFGEWTWISSSGGLAPTTITPSTTGDKKKIVFTEQGIYKFYKNGIRRERMKYSVTKADTIYHNWYILSYSEENKNSISKQQQFYFGGSDTLYLYDYCDDCYSHIYIK